MCTTETGRGAMATAHLLFGPMGAGKTTLARRLEAELPALRLTHDEWVVQLYGTDPPAALFAEQFARVEALIDRVWTQVLALGQDIVLDQGLWSRARRDKVRALASAAGGHVRLYALDCDLETAWARVRNRHRDDPGNLRITRPTFELLWRKLEPLGPDEPHERVD